MTGYSVSRFSGSGLSTLRFFEGAYKQNHTFGSFNGATEFRDSFYVSAPSNSMVGRLDSVDLSTDAFYQSPAQVAPLPSDISCSARADLELSLDFENNAMRAVTALCEGERIDGDTRLCEAVSLNNAIQRYPQVCSLGNPS